MLKWLLPHETDFYTYFEQHAALLIKGTEELFTLLSEGHSVAHQKAMEIKDLEHEADIITRACIEDLHKTFITPFQRDDIFRLITKMDDIMDLTEDTSQLVLIYHLHEMTEAVQILANILVQATHKLESIIKSMRNLTDIKNMQGLLNELKQLEKDGDLVYREAIKALFEQSQDAIQIMKWKEIYGLIEQALDRCLAVGSIVEGVILEST